MSVYTKPVTEATTVTFMATLGNVTKTLTVTLEP